MRGLSDAAIEEHNARLELETPQQRLAFAVDLFEDELLFTSSFGAGSAVMLHLWSRIAPHLPVVFLDTGFLFPETLAYRDRLASELGLKVEVVRPALPTVEFLATHGDDIYRKNSDFCCQENKIAPLKSRIATSAAWVSGVRRDQSTTRANVPILLADGKGPIKVHPLATFTAADAAAYIAQHGLPEHPLRADGYLSIGCAPCTRAVKPGEDERAGRWAWSEKTECGLHQNLVRPRTKAT